MIGIQTKSIPASNTRPRRIVAFTCNGHRIVRTHDNALDEVQAHFAVAQALIASQFRDAPDASTMVYGGTQEGYFFCWPQSTISSVSSLLIQTLKPGDSLEDRYRVYSEMVADPRSFEDWLNH
jgi:hypothetical protein